MHLAIGVYHHIDAYNASKAPTERHFEENTKFCPTFWPMPMEM